MARTLVVLSMSLLALAVMTAGIAAQGGAPAARCAAELVRYEWNESANGAPWIAVGPTRSRLEAWLYTYPFEDRRVNRSERLVLQAGREEKIGWFSRKLGGRELTIVGRRLDGSGSFRQRFRAASGATWYPSGLVIPTVGCWQLTVRTTGWVHRLVVETLEPVSARTCDATPVDEVGWATLTPRRARIAAGLGWRTPEGGALLYTGGRTPEGGNTKVLWRRTRDVSQLPGGDLVLRGKQLDGTGTFVQRLREVSPRGHWPSIVVVPNPGCWLLTAQINAQPGAAGVLVVRVV